MSCINEDIKSELILEFGIDRTIEFCEMVYKMYKMLHEDLVARGIAVNEYDEFDYNYESIWWKNKYNELKTRKDERTRPYRAIP